MVSGADLICRHFQRLVVLDCEIEVCSRDSIIENRSERPVAIYPNLPADFEVRLRAIEVAAKGVENYLDTVECPYSEALRGMLRRLLNDRAGRFEAMAERVSIFEAPGVADGDKFDVLLREVENTIDEMKSIERAVNGGGAEGGDTGDRIALIKAKTVLLEKWATLKERVLTLKEMSQFQTAIISVLDDICDVDQRAEFRDRLRNFKSVTGI